MSSYEHDDVNCRTVHAVHCRTESRIKSYKYTWTIPYFWQTCKFLSSLDSSNVAEQPFRLRMYTALDNRLKFFLIIDNEAYVKGTYQAFIKTTEGEELRKTSHENILRHDTLLYEIDISYIRENEIRYMIDNTFIICFMFHIIDGYFHNFIYETEINRTFPFDGTSFLAGTLSNGETDSHTTFIIDGKRLYTSKDLLCLKSSIFKDMLESKVKEDVNEDANEIEITDMKYDILKLLLFFINTNTLPTQRIDTETIIDLFIAANKYNIRDLKVLCENNLMGEIKFGNVAKILEVALLNNGKQLETYARNFIKLNIESIIEDEKFIKLAEKYPLLFTEIMEKSQFNIEEANYIWSWYT